MLHHLLVPLDGSPDSEATLPVAAYLAEKTQSQVTLLHVIEHDAPATVHGQPHLRDVPEAEEYLRKIAQSAFPESLKVDWHVHGRGVRDVAHSLADHAEEFEPQLVIIRAHGEEKLHNWLFGTIPQQIVRQGAVPVLLLQPNAQGVIRFPFQRILVPLDGKPDHEKGLGIAAELARLCQARMQLISVIPTPDRLSGPGALTGSFLPESTRLVLDMEVEQVSRYLLGQVEALTASGLDVTGHVLRGEPLEMIEQAAGQFDTDLIALGTHGKAGTAAFWSGSIAQRLIHHLPLSFLLAPARPDEPHE